MSRATLWAYLLGLSFLWGACFPVVRYAVQSMPPLPMAAARAGFAAAGLLAFVLVLGLSVPRDRRTRLVMLVLGLLNGFLPNVLTAMALGRITSAQGSLIGAFGPLATAALAALLLREASLTRRRLCGMGLGVAGIAWIFAPLAMSGQAPVVGGLLMLGTTLCYSCSTVFARWARPHASAAVALGQQLVSMAPALVLATAFGPAQAFEQPAPIWLAVAGLGVLGSAVPFALYLRMLRTATAADAAMLAYLQPVWATGIAAAVLGEWPEPRVLLGGALVLAGVWLASSGSKPAEARGGERRG